MRVVEVLRTAVEANLECVHRRRLQAVWRCVIGLVRGGQLCLTGLGRSLPGTTSDKHRIKAVDRLLGNERLQLEVERFYRAIALWLLRRVRMPVIAVDWTGAGSHHFELSAKLCCEGRALPLLSMVFPKHDYASQPAHRQFLSALSRVLPERCAPILVTDAGFYLGWFDAVVPFGWHYIGRVRGTTGVVVEGARYKLTELHRLAGAKPRNLGNVLLGFSHARCRRMVLSREPRLQGRHRRTKRGGPGRSLTDRMASKGAREPWVLVTSLSCNAAAIVQMYALRMQIEQAFRDRKSYRNGWSMRLAQTRSCVRLSVLLLIASLADLTVQLAGRAVATTAVARGFQANTVRKKRVLSFFFMGTRALRTGVETTETALAHAIAGLLATLRQNAEISALK